MIEKVSIVVASTGVLLTALPFLQTNAWWIRVLDFPRLQIAVFCLLGLLLLCCCTDWRKIYNLILISLLSIALLYQCSLIIPFSPLYPPEAQASMTNEKQNSFTILQANVKMINRNVEPLLGLVDRMSPDIISINEPDGWWEKQLALLDTAYPFYIKKPLANTYGMILYSKFPLKNAEINYLVVDDVPSFYAKVILPSGISFNLHCVHPEPPRPGSSTYDRDTELFIVGRRIRREEEPSIVVGDLNDVAWSRTTKKFKRYSRMLDPRKGRGLFNTFNANWPLLRYPLDHVFFTRDFRLQSLEKMQHIGSDHFPMFIGVKLLKQ